VYRDFFFFYNVSVYKSLVVKILSMNGDMSIASYLKMLSRIYQENILTN